MALNQDKSRKSGMGIIASRERKKEFDAAVKEVMRQRKAAQNLQNAIRQSKREGRPMLQRQASGTRQLQLDASNHKSKNLMRRATVAGGGRSTDNLQDLQKLRAAHHRPSDGGGNYHGGNNNATFQPIKIHSRQSAPDIARSAPPKSAEKRVVGGPRPRRFSASVTDADEVKRDVLALTKKNEGGLSYQPTSMKKRVSSQPILSSSQLPTPATVTRDKPEESTHQKNDSWSLSQAGVEVFLPGVRLEDLVPTRGLPTSPNRNNNALLTLDDSENSDGRQNPMVNQWKSKTLKMFPNQIDFDLGADSPTSQSGGVEKTPDGETKLSAADHDYDNKDCPRKKFAEISSGGGSKSGGTGNTSRGSMFSSRGSLSEGHSNPAVAPSIAAIDEEGRIRPKGGEGDEHSLQSTSSRFSLKSLRNRASRRSRRLSHIRRSIRKSFSGKSDGGIPLVINDLGDDVDSNIARAHSQSGVDTEKVRRHLERKASTQSITSAYSNVTETSVSRKEKRPPGWRFRLNKGGFRNQSMTALSVERPGNHSRRSIGSWCLDDESSTGSSFTEFYDNELHSGLMRSVLSKSSSARSLGLSLPTVAEGEQNQMKKVEEQKEEETVDNDIAEQTLTNGKLDASDKSSDTAESFYRHPAHEHPLLHVRPNQLFPDSPGWRCDLCMEDTVDLNEWAYVSTGLNYLLCERCFCRDGEALTA